MLSGRNADRCAVLTGVGLVMIGQIALSLVPAVAIGWITQGIAEHRAASTIVWLVVVLGRRRCGGRVGRGCAVGLHDAARLREDALDTALALPIDQIEANGVGDLVARVSGDVHRISEAAGRAVLVLGHRLTQPADTDVIVVLDNGVVRERGTHAELVASDGGYAALWRSRHPVG
jgi:ABC-type multidrug transport system fused ATPase/permease subunit